jgi:F-type H+-transporting ATPase subunit alpha
MAFSLFAANEGFLDDVDLEKITDFEASMLSYMRTEKTDFLNSLNDTGSYNDDIVAEMKAALEAFKSKGTW